MLPSKESAGRGLGYSNKEHRSVIEKDEELKPLDWTRLAKVRSLGKCAKAPNWDQNGTTTTSLGEQRDTPPV